MEWGSQIKRNAALCRGRTETGTRGTLYAGFRGRRTARKEIYEKIKTDSRHHLITILNEGQLEVRNFENWSMGFELLTADHIHKHPGYIELNNAFLRRFGRKRFNFALNYLKSFYELRTSIC